MTDILPLQNDFFGYILLFKAFLTQPTSLSCFKFFKWNFITYISLKLCLTACPKRAIHFFFNTESQKKKRTYKKLAQNYRHYRDDNKEVQELWHLIKLLSLRSTSADSFQDLFSKKAVWPSRRRLSLLINVN